MKKRIPFLWKKEEDCCGCSACLALCPVQAIEMKLNAKGFLYPYIDESKCIHCGNCIEACSYKNDKRKFKITNKPTIYAATAKDKGILKKSSSGGLFTLFSDYIIRNSGAIISAIYNAETYKVEFTLYDSLEIRDSARGSKYIQADMADIFNQGYEWLIMNPEKSLLFIGTGCQAAGFEIFAQKKKIRSRVIIIDLICHGAPSPGLWKKFAEFTENKERGKMTAITFKDKRNGWINPSVYGIINGNEVSIERYSEWFYGSYSIRKSCYSCPYTKITRNTDITIGDFWGVHEKYPNFFDPDGVSLSIIHTKNGNDFFENIKNDIKWIEVSEENCLQPRLIAPANKPKNYRTFWKDLDTKGLDYCEKKYKGKNKISYIMHIKKALKKYTKCNLKVIKSNFPHLK